MTPTASHNPDRAWVNWKQTEPQRLARYVDPNAIVHWFGVPAPRNGTAFDERQTDRRTTVRALYDHMAALNIAYETARLDFANGHEAEQVIRPPHRVRQEGGNCLELALVFAGLSEHQRLRPLVVLLEGHALLALWLEADVDPLVRTGRPAPGDHTILSGGRIRDAGDPAVKAALLRMVETDSFILVECTGFAYSETLHGAAGRLTFDEAVLAGHERLRHGSLIDLLDIAYLHGNRLYTPYDLPVASGHPTAGAPTARLGDRGAKALFDALAQSDGAPPHGDRWTEPDLRRLSQWLGSHQVGPPDVTDHLRQLVEDLSLALRAASFIRQWIPAERLTSAALRKALLATLPGALRESPVGLDDHLDLIALRHPVTDDGCGRAVVEFTLRLAMSAELDVCDPGFEAWAESVADIAHVNDLRNRLTAQTRTSDVRLVVDLHAVRTTARAERLRAWLLDGDEVLAPPWTAGEDRAEGKSLEEAMADIYEDAFDIAEQHGLLIGRVDVAVPTSLMVRYKPEECRIGDRLGAHHDVVVRWSDHLRPQPPERRRALRMCRLRLAKMEQDGLDTAIEWIPDADARDRATLTRRIHSGDYKAVGLRSLPSADPEGLLDLLLLHVPILMWPEESVADWDEVECDVRDWWPDLPAAFLRAYRTAWRADASEKLPALAKLRAVWHDREWQRFCDVLKRHRAGFAPSGGQL
ncbi:vWA-MoxR associated conflict system protein [Streptomyces sp. 7N604]|uniref:vWA-MoxR associated conflict system protein n=1 Tax=Streptomyces sp. 7N604 TaxID=3457415 RepID=UPI003FD2D979